MNKFCCFILFLLISFSLSAREISKELAIRIAKEQMQMRQPGFSRTISKVDCSIVLDKNVYYVVHYYPEGWIIISADDMVAPLIGYSFDGDFSVNNQPESVKAWMDVYSNQIRVASDKIGEPVLDAWRTKSPKSLQTKEYSRVEPLIKVMWNQSRPYNQYCPSDANGQAVVGCVAVAMAQAMSVSQHPARPQGSFSYFCSPYGNLSIDYDNEPSYNWSIILSGSDLKVAAARLLYQCGVSIRMNYSATGSGTQTSYVPGALKSYFDYPSSVVAYSRNSYEGNWESLILNELLAGRPVIYSGYDGVSASGHCFNLDGYDGNNMYHVNWGWGGQNNGYYTIDALRDGDQDYTKQQMAVVGIRAPSQGPTEIRLSNSTIAGNLPVGTVVGDVIVESEASSPNYTYELKGIYSVFTHDYLPAAFYIENNELKTKEVFDYEDGDQSVIIKVTNTNNGLSFEKEFVINVTENSTPVQTQFVDSFSIMINGKCITILGADNCEYGLFSVSGILLKSGHLSSSVSEILTNSFPSGCYIIRVINSNKNVTSKILILN